MFRFAVIGLVVTLAACESMTTPAETSTGQAWLCGREYVNHAWGYQRRGVVLDTAGNVWKYELRGSTGAPVQGWSPKDVSRLSESDLKLRYEGAVTTGQKVSASDIARSTAWIADAAQATPTQPAPRGADMGQTLMYCYTYDARTKSYSQVMLDNTGDWVSTNPSPAAAKLREWLSATFGES